MTLEEVIQELSKVYSAKDELVIHRSMESHPSVKFLKKFKYSLFSTSINPPKQLFVTEYSEGCCIEDLKDKFKELDKRFLGELFKWLKDDTGKQISD